MTKVMGMMSGCYFVGRGELLEWVNNLCKTNYTKVEELSNGAAFCQIIDCIHPGTVNLGRVNYNATQPFEMSQNYKILQDAFNKNHISQFIDIVTLTKGKYMAALEMFQWIHGYYQQTGPHDEYDAVARRKATKCAEPKFASKKPPAHQSGFPTSKPNVPLKTNDLPIGQIGSHVVKSKVKKDSAAAAGGSARVSMTKAQLSQQKEKELMKENEMLKEKLRMIEEYCQQNEDNEMFEPILQILHQEEDNE
ncbi:Microtubule-associated protein RP/EB family member 1 [Tritrichomonas foetus]|uniref:Microtubule-associated protein RP/EB family member 1 n=1 Tax=Tritrichomonas foetus TaxID=1144522 RepID=A0A1J4JLL8_9EUKA|nr:Microtubule-associated protein RP/EB family member 1 [Tritrichomonas foetus]|eukprot:OHS98459.1 Microtubule-associated protein RP/EB family member 1 [Tritrichomonas foetus]